jgi:general transcriptional corepressor TUP1
MAGGSQGGLVPPQPGQQQSQPGQPQGAQQQQQSQQGHAPPQEQPLGPQHQMGQGPPGLPVPPPHPNAQQAPYSQNYPPGPVSNGMGPQPQSTASPGPGRRGIGRPPGAVGPATPQVNTPVPYPGSAASPQVSHPTPEHGRMGGPHAPAVGNALGDLEVDSVAPHNKKTGQDWYAIFNPQVQRVLDVDLVHSLNHESVVCCVRFSHDGKYVATGCNRSAQIFDVQTGEKVCVLEDHNASDMSADLYIRSVCFSPDGRYLATGAEDKLIRVSCVVNVRLFNRLISARSGISKPELFEITSLVTSKIFTRSTLLVMAEQLPQAVAIELCACGILSKAQTLSLSQ